jgi:NAD(P)-dependent dehydrogenase (short-subunit alcohol dehydrogenase family)
MTISQAATSQARVAIVTGAGSGVGRVLAVSLLEQGWRLVLVGRREDRLKETAASAPSQSAPSQAVRVVACDVGAAGAAELIVGTAVGEFGRVDALVNNAGVARFAGVSDASAADVALMVATNLVGPLALIGAAAGHLAVRRGVVVNVGSIGGVLALPGRAAYGASKAGLHHLTRSLARELAPDVRVNAVAPGAIDTEMYDDTGLSAARVRELRAEMVATTPLGRMGRPEDVVPWIEMLLGPAGDWVTGSVIVVDGGRSC